MKEEVEIEFEKGEFAEAMPWKIILNLPVPDPEHRCCHVKDGVSRAVVVALNEGGFNGTEVCLDCILDAVKEHDL